MIQRAGSLLMRCSCLPKTIAALQRLQKPPCGNSASDCKRRTSGKAVTRNRIQGAARCRISESHAEIDKAVGCLLPPNHAVGIILQDHYHKIEPQAALPSPALASQ